MSRTPQIFLIKRRRTQQQQQKKNSLIKRGTGPASLLPPVASIMTRVRTYTLPLTAGRVDDQSQTGKPLR
jgi:hypothetical protein